MTTTTSLLKKAAELEDDARALRRAAALLNGHLSAKAAADLPARLAKATAIRGARKFGTMRELAAARLAALNELLDADKTYRMRDLIAELAERGVVTTGSTVSQDIRRLGWRSSGRHAGATWAHANGGDASPKRGRRKRAGRAKPDVAKQRRATAKLLKRIERRGEPVTASFFKHDKTSPAVLVRHGYLARTADGFTRTDKVFEV